MESIKIEVTGNIARIISKPARITAGTVGLPVEFTFDSQWDNLCKTAVFLAGEKRMVDDSIENTAIVPWEVLERPGFHLYVGVYGVDLEGNTAMLTHWVKVGAIHASANPKLDPLLHPTLPVWQKLLNMVGQLFNLKTNVKTDLVRAINEVYDKAEANSTNGLIMGDEKPTLKPILWFDTSEDQMTYVDDNGEEYLLFPKTKLANVLGLEAALASKAPAGYGLGANLGKYAADANNIAEIGVFHSAKNVPDVDSYWLIDALSYGSGTKKQTAYAISETSGIDDAVICRRSMDEGVWLPWEWDNPPLKQNTEYRTTRRWAGEPIYMKYVYLGGISDGGTKTIDHGIQNIDYAIRVTLFDGLGTLNDIATSLRFTPTDISMTIPSGVGGKNLYAVFEYVKTK